MYYLLTNWLAYLYGRIQSPRPDVIPDRRENKALNDQLVRSIQENIPTLVFRSVRTSKLRSEYFPVWTSQLVNKIIVLSSKILPIYTRWC